MDFFRSLAVAAAGLRAQAGRAAGCGEKLIRAERGDTSSSPSTRGGSARAACAGKMGRGTARRCRARSLLGGTPVVAGRSQDATSTLVPR